MVRKITALTLQKRNRQRVNVFLDGEFAFGLARIVAAWLQVGQEISDEKIAELLAADARETAYQQALNFLNYRPRTESEIRQNLEKHKVPEEIIAEVMERLGKAGLVDDARFAELWVENRNELRPRSRRALAYELKQRGLSEDVIQHAVAGVNDEELAFEAASRHAQKLRHLEWQDFRQKMYGFLARRGFNYEVSQPVTARVWAQLHAGDPDQGSYDFDEDE